MPLYPDRAYDGEHRNVRDLSELTPRMEHLPQFVHEVRHPDANGQASEQHEQNQARPIWGHGRRTNCRRLDDCEAQRFLVLAVDQ